METRDDSLFHWAFRKTIVQKGSYARFSIKVMHTLGAAWQCPGGGKTKHNPKPNHNRSDLGFSNWMLDIDEALMRSGIGMTFMLEACDNTIKSLRLGPYRATYYIEL